MNNKLQAYIQLFRLHRPIGWLLVLWPTLTALWLASDGIPNVKLLIIFTLGAIIVRSAGCAINDYVDRDFDGKVMRTQDRPLATGDLSPKEALAGFAVMSLLALLLVLQLNRLTIYLSLVAILLAVSYPFFKRFTYLPQVYLGFAMNWGIVMAWAAVTNKMDFRIIILYLATILWTIVYDTYYAIADREDDVAAGIQSTAILWQGKIARVTGVLQLFYLVLISILGYVFNLSTFYFIGVIVIAGLFIYHQRLTKDELPGSSFKAFLYNHHVGWVLLLSVMF